MGRTNEIMLIYQKFLKLVPFLSFPRIMINEIIFTLTFATTLSCLLERIVSVVITAGIH